MACRGAEPGSANMPGFCCTIGTPTALVTETSPLLCCTRTKALVLVLSFTSNGICALIWVGETYNKGARMPSKYSCTPPNPTGNPLALGSAAALVSDCRWSWEACRCTSTD